MNTPIMVKKKIYSLVLIVVFHLQKSSCFDNTETAVWIPLRCIGTFLMNYVWWRIKKKRRVLLKKAYSKFLCTICVNLLIEQKVLTWDCPYQEIWDSLGTSTCSDCQRRTPTKVNLPYSTGIIPPSLDGLKRFLLRNWSIYDGMEENIFIPGGCYVFQSPPFHKEKNQAKHILGEMLPLVLVSLIVDEFLTLHGTFWCSKCIQRKKEKKELVPEMPLTCANCQVQVPKWQEEPEYRQPMGWSRNTRIFCGDFSRHYGKDFTRHHKAPRSFVTPDGYICDPCIDKWVASKGIVCVHDDNA